MTTADEDGVCRGVLIATNRIQCVLEAGSMAGDRQSGLCPTHGRPTKRSECAGCNAAYMRSYLSERRKTRPAAELWKRAHNGAKKLDLPFNLAPKSIVIPALCPALGIPLIVGGQRTANSPSLDRIIPSLGYVSGKFEGHLRSRQPVEEQLHIRRTADPSRAGSGSVPCRLSMHSRVCGARDVAGACLA